MSEGASNPQPTAVFVKVTDEQRARHEARYAAWLDTLRAQAADDSDLETQANARLLLANHT